MRRISASTNMFFFMFARHIRSGSPVLADCARTNSSGVCVPVPIGSVALEYNSPALAAIAIRSSIGIARSAARARAAFRASRWISPPFARLTVAIGSPVEKWTTSSFSSES
jgi:hypothetical protein